MLPTERLADVIKEFHLLQIHGQQDQTMVAIDDGCYDFMFYQGRAVTLEFEHTKVVEIRKNVFTVHQLNPPLKYKFGKTMSYFGVKVQPWLNHFFFPHHYEKGVLDLESMYRSQIATAKSVIFEQVSFAEKVKAAEEFLLQIKPDLDEKIDLVKQICQEIYRTQGMITVHQLAARFNCNRQFLNKTFKAHVNSTLKKFIITVRIISLIKFRINNPTYSLTQVALEFDYFDQAHFNYDFKRISGISPTKFFNNLPPFFHRHRLVGDSAK